MRLWYRHLRECQPGVLLTTFGQLTDRDVVVVVDADQVSELQVACHTRCLAGNALHGAPVSKETICVVVDQVKAWLVENRGSMGLGHGETNSIAKTLTQRPRSNFDARGIV